MKRAFWFDGSHMDAQIAADKTSKDPYEALIKVIDSSRYQSIEDAIMQFVV